jgi:hypothetical protein
MVKSPEPSASKVEPRTPVVVVLINAILVLFH